MPRAANNNDKKSVKQKTPPKSKGKKYIITPGDPEHFKPEEENHELKLGTDTLPTYLFPIVAIGSSAGGLEAMIPLVKNLNTDTGMAFVFVQHLDPKKKTLLPEILARETSMPVHLIKNAMQPQPNNIYIIPSNTTLTFEKGKFKISPRTRQPGIHMAIDYFMRSLTQDRSHFPIGVLLSGSDADGIIGMEYVKTEGGITFAQDRYSAKFPDMPRSAINFGVVDFELPPDAIAKELNMLSRIPYLGLNKPKPGEQVLIGKAEEIKQIMALLKSHTNVDFTDYKPNTINRRILRRMVVHKLESIGNYIKLLKGSPQEVNALYEDILINVTSFFRDPHVYESLKKNVFPKLFEKRKPTAPIRIWVTACSTGEEAYSVAISLLEYLDDKVPPVQVQIFSTDLSDSGIEKARKGIYSEDIKGDVSPERLKKYFNKLDHKYQVNKTIRDMCVFAKQNIVQDPPFSSMDIISCRNVLIYLGQVLQRKVIPVFHYALKPDGFLVLGTSETIGTFSDLFELIDKKNKIYLKKNTTTRVQFDFRSSDFRKGIQEISGINERARHDNFKRAFDLQRQTDNIILNDYAPASVVIKSNFEVVQIRGKIDPYLMLPQGIPDYNLLNMAREGLVIELQSAVGKAIKEGALIRHDRIKVKNAGGFIDVNIIVLPVEIKTTDESVYLVIFEEASKTFPLLQSKPEGKAGKGGPGKESENDIIKHLQQELDISKNYLQSVIEQQEMTNEELRSANEEIQSSNEELQSTNEELETAKEELQSSNEELITVNEELQNRNIELSTVNNDLSNLLMSLSVPVVILDINLRIRRFTGAAEKLMNLIPTDIGRLITDINPAIDIPDFEKQIHEVMETPTIKDFEARDKWGSWYLVRIRPYKTLDNKIDGVVIVAIDINNLKLSMEKLKEYSKEIETLNRTLEKRVNDRVKELNQLNANLEKEITERKHIENSLRILSRHLVSAQEGERLKISRELHDGINQILSTVKIKLHNAEEIVKSGIQDKAVISISDARMLTEKTIKEVRNISKNLRPITLDEFGISASLKTLCEDFDSRNRFNIECTIPPLKQRFDAELELALYRILQEALFNIEKHSAAANVNVTLAIENKSIKFTITDDGKGFDLNEFRKRNKKLQRMGLIGMSERAQSFGGTFDIKSAPGKGTEITVIFPLTIKG